MSDTGNAQKLTFPGLLGAVLVLSGGAGSIDARAASPHPTGLHQSASPLVVAEVVLAQAGPIEEPAAEETIDGSGGQAEAEDVPFSELNEALTAARSRLAELTKAAEIAKVAGEIRKKLEATEAENRQLKSVLSQLQTDNGELHSAKQTVERRLRELEEASAKAASETERLQRELTEARARASAAEQAGAESAGELAELQQVTEDATEDSARLARDLDSTITELAATQQALQEANVALESAEAEGGALRAQLTGNRSEADDLRARLETAEDDLDQMRTRNSGLEQQVELLKAAAGEATDAARQNLLAVEDQINEINAALALVKAEELLPALGDSFGQDEVVPAAAAPAAPPETAATADRADGWVPRPSPPRSDTERQLIAAAAPDVAQVPAARSPLAEGPPSAPALNLASLATDLPAGRRQDAAVLLAGLGAERGPRGLSMTVPGELLFAVNSERIEPAAFDALASVAELVDLYGERDVLIVGHTDAVGDADYNQRLSERRAALVKSYFVENFQISEGRLQIEGKGEQDPITSNATADGRNANRRVEVVILD